MVMIVLSISFFSCLGVSAETLPAVEVSGIESLDKKISVDFVNANLKDVLKIFTRQTGVNFVIDSDVSSETISLFLEKVTVRQALKSISESSSLGFYPISGTSVLRVGAAQEGERDSRVTKVFKLKYASVARLELSDGAEILQTGDVGSGGGATGTEDDSEQIFTTGESDSTEGVINAVVSVLSADGILSIDGRMNALIVTDYPDRIKRIERIIEQLDRKVKQILIKTEIVELTESINDVLGTSFGNATEPTQLFSLNYLFPKVDGQVFPFDNNVFSERITAGDGNAARLADTTFGKLTGGQFDFILKALKTSGKSKFLARPRIVTLDNEPAVVDITSETAIQENTTIDPDTNQQTTSVERTAVGITLRVTPQINDNESVTMVLQPTVTEVAPSRLFPDRAFDPSTRSVLTRIRVKQGETISIAGLIQKKMTKSGSKVPFLGEIPFIGALFSSKAKEGLDTDLIVFVTPYILDDDNISFLQKRAEDEDDFGEMSKESDRMKKFMHDQAAPEVSAERERLRMSEASLEDKIVKYEAAVREYPSDPEAHSNLGVAYAKAQKYDLAIEEFKKSIMLKPNSGAAYNNLGNLYRIKKQYDAAISSLRRAVELVPDHPYAYTTLGLCYEMKNMYEEAQLAYRKALNVASDSAWTNTARERLAVLDAGY